MIRFSNLIVIAVLGSVSLWSAVHAQSINISGTVVDNGTSAGIANAKVKLLEFPSCTTRTDANGGFVLSGASTAIQPQMLLSKSCYEATLSGNRLAVNTDGQPVGIAVDVFNILGKEIFHAEKFAAGLVEFNSLWETPGLYYVKVQAGNELHVLSSFGLQQNQTVPSLAAHEQKSLAKTSAVNASVFTIEAGKAGYDSKQASTTALTGSAGVIRLSTYSQAPGIWKEVTPSADTKSGYTGIVSVAVDPVRQSDCWFGAAERGIWKSTDYGITWNHINTGTNSASLNTGRQWYLQVEKNPNRDPSRPPIICTVLGYGAQGVWKSVDGGVNWTNVFTNSIYASDGITNISTAIGHDMVTVLMPDSDPNHLLATLFTNAGAYNGIFESTDGGGKWIDHLTPNLDFTNHGARPMTIDKSTWIVANPASWPTTDVWRTTDGAATWHLSTGKLGAGAGPGLLVLDTLLYIGGDVGGLFKSTDKGASWTNIFGGWAGWVVATPTKLYVFRGGNAYDAANHASWALRTNDQVWTDIPNSTNSTTGGVPQFARVVFDGTHYIILAANQGGGIYRYLEP